MRMMPVIAQDVTKLIQLAIAPVFLLSAVAASLLVFANRLARVVDRGRHVEEEAAKGVPVRGSELSILERRAHLIYLALTMGVGAAILVCFLMSVAFLGTLLGFNTAWPVALLFIGALMSYTGALLCLLREVFLAIGNFHLGIGPAAKKKR